MNPYFKAYLKNAALGATTGALTGAACGAVAGNAGLNQMCAGNADPEDCIREWEPSIIPYAKDAAANVGAVAGAAVGMAIGAIIYPAYKGFMGWVYGSSTLMSEESVENTVKHRLDV
jgi:hypothetical protein